MLQRGRSALLGPKSIMVDPDFERSYPTLWDHLTQLTWEDGAARKPSTIGVYPEAGIVRVLFRDVDSGLMTWVAVTRMSEVWPALEAVLLDTGADWRVDRRVKGDVASRTIPPVPVSNGIDKRRSKR